MHRYGRTRALIRWATSVCLLITSVLWVVSYFRYISYWVPKTNVMSGAGSSLSPPGTWPLNVHSLQPGILVFNGYGYSHEAAPSISWTNTPQTFGTPWKAWLQIMPTLSGKWGETVIPLWLPFLLFGTPAFLLWRPEVRRWKALRYAGRKKVVQKTFGPKAERIVSLVIGILALIIAFVFLDILDKYTPSFIRQMTIRIAEFSEPLFLIMLLLIWLAVSYCIAMLINRWVLWKSFYIDTPLCPRCNYNLTGNTSGRCPECGTATPSTSC
jgi:hypothetical protein